ncbi:MAG: right-handed parallel beta-helix repeat-containing protein, partial [Prevotella sp.]|nr:right-handed parallel beta-helix repeat-containing protein [Prevotella sp.]
MDSCWLLKIVEITRWRILLSITCLLSFCLSIQATEDVIIDVEPGEFSIEQALQKARLMRLQGQDIRPVIKLHAGIYRISQPIIIRPEDNNTKIVGEGNVIINGGVEIKGWKKQGKWWVADVPEWNGRPLEFRQLWVNGKKAIRARDVEDFEQMTRILSVDKSKETIYVPSSSVKKIIHAHHAEMVLHEMWCIANLRIKEVKMMGDSAALTFHNPESHIHFMHPWPSPMVTTDGHNSAFYLTNAKELLDKPGEWFLDTKEQKLYYMPRQDEDMRNADVEAPALETLLKVEGTADQPVENVSIEGVSFQYATWMRPSIQGHAPLQAGMYMIEAYKIRPQISRPNGDHKLDN